MNIILILFEMLAFAAIFTLIIFFSFRGEKKYSPASIHHYPKDIQEEYFKTHECIDIRYKSKNVILMKSFDVLIFTLILFFCAVIAGAKSFSEGFFLSFGLMV